MDKHELRERVLKTFVEAFLAVLLPDVGIIVNQIVNEREVWWAVLLPVVASAIAAGISAAWNTLKPPAQQQPPAETPEPPQDPPNGIS